MKPVSNTRLVRHEGKRLVFCSEPCAWIFRQEPDRYDSHKGLVSRILSGDAPANLLELLRKYFKLTPDVWGKDARGGNYSWLGDGADLASIRSA